MALKKGRKKSGGRYIKRRKKKKDEVAGQKRNVKLGEERKKTQRAKGGSIRTFLIKEKFVNVQMKDGKKKKIEIKNVSETPSNKFLARQNIITKGTIVETEFGKVKITNRPSQESSINGILI